MNLLRKINWLFTAVLCIALVSSCSDDDVVSGNGTSGFLKLRLTSSKTVTRATTLDYMSDAKKVEVSMLYNDMYVTQSLNLSSVANATDLGLESEKLELRAGEYRIMSYSLFGAVKPDMEKPERLATIYPDESLVFQITGGHLTELDVKVKATVRGYVYFDLLKDLSNYEDEMDKANTSGKTRAALESDPKEFSYNNVEIVDIYYRKKGTSEYATPHSFKVYDTNNEKYLHTDTISWESGEYEITRYMMYDKDRRSILLAADLKDTYVKVTTGDYAKGSVNIKFPENMYAIKDYMALYTIWVNMDGPNWSYAGESFPTGANWRFANRPIDEWGNQPGVELDSYGRVKTLELGSFNPKGAIPDALGDLTELVSLSLGTHNDLASVENFEGDKVSYSLNPIDLYRKGIDYRGRRMEIAKERLSILHPSPTDNGKLYTSKKVTPLKYATFSTYDFSQGAISNRITKIPATIRNLTKLNYLFVANSLVGLNDDDLPIELAELPDLTDVEFYNCKFKRFPTALEKMKKVVSLNFSCNATMEPAELLRGLNAFITSCKDELQILYVSSCGLEEFPTALIEATKIGLLDFSFNKLRKLPGTGRKLAPVQAFFDDNKITEIAEDFCETDDIEKFSASNNMLKVFPNLFKDGKDSKYQATSVDFSDNHIERFAEGFNGINVETLTLTKNDFGKANKDEKGKGYFPGALKGSGISYLLINNCELDTLPLCSFEDLEVLEALDLSGNNLRNLPVEFYSRNLVFVSGLNLSYNRFGTFPMKAMELPMLNKLYLNDQWDIDRKTGKETRPLQTWPSALASYPGYATLRLLDVSGNDIRKVPDSNFPTLLAEFNITSNSNIDMTVPSGVCSNIASGLYNLVYDSNQSIFGCPILDLDMNK